jgi:hypothetical protein
MLLAACAVKPSTSAAPVPTLTAPVTTPSAPIARPRTVIFNCLKGADSAPATIVFACADAGAGLRRLSWTQWGAPRAIAVGVRYQNDCVPNCAGGHFHEYPARAVAYTLGTIAGRRAYTRLDVTVSGPHPTYIKNLERYELAEDGPRGPQ